MTNERKIRIAKSFSDKYAESELNLKLSVLEFEKFENGIYAGSMDEKWNIFLIQNDMYWARSWTDNCIFKIQFEKQNGGVVLKNIKVTRNPNEYKSSDLEYDIGIFNRMLDFYLDRKS